jgi:hypothetical protein
MFSFPMAMWIFSSSVAVPGSFIDLKMKGMDISLIQVKLPEVK